MKVFWRIVAVAFWSAVIGIGLSMVSVSDFSQSWKIFSIIFAVVLSVMNFEMESEVTRHRRLSTMYKLQSENLKDRLKQVSKEYEDQIDDLHGEIRKLEKRSDNLSSMLKMHAPEVYKKRQKESETVARIVDRFYAERK